MSTKLNTIQDWRKLAELTLPRLEEYASNYGLSFDIRSATSKLVDRADRSLHNQLEKLRFDLPDDKTAQRGAFWDLARLCSATHLIAEGSH